MQSLLVERIQYYKKQIAIALEQNDSIAALKSFAVQKELEVLLNKVALRSNQIAEMPDLNDYYISDEVSKMLGIHQSNVTRRAQQLGGQKCRGKWYFPKNNIEKELQKKHNRKKPGRRAGYNSGVD